MTTATEFTAIARELQRAAQRLGLTVPAFRTAPTGADRSIRRFPNGTVVMVRRDQDAHGVARDCIDGILAANADMLSDSAAVDTMRHNLWVALEPVAA